MYIEVGYVQNVFTNIHSSTIVRGVSPMRKNWISNMPSQIRDPTSRGLVTKSCPQGGILSLSLRSVVKDLVLNSQEAGYSIAGVDELRNKCNKPGELSKTGTISVT